MNTKTDNAENRSLQSLVRPFAAHETAQWRRRAEILETLGYIHDLADEARINLDWRERSSETSYADMQRAGAALEELRKALTILWPNEKVSDCD